MDLQRTLWRGLAVILLVGSGIVMAPAAPAQAWDADTRTIPCGATHTIPAPFGATATYDNAAKSAATIFVFTNDKKLPTDGNSLRHFISTDADGGLKFELKSTSVVVKAAKCPKPPVQPPAEEPREYVPCFTDPLIPYDKRHGYSTRFLNDKHTEGVVIIYLDRERVESLGRAVLHPFWTKDTRYKGRNYTCELKFKGVAIDGKSYVSVTSVAIRNPDKTD